jgi:DNA modification methylase
MLLHGDALAILTSIKSGSIQCCVTSPPYWGLRDYKVDGQIGLEPTPEAYVAKMVAVFREVRRVLRKDGTCWLNLGDSYWGGKGKSGYELPHEAEARRANGETFQTAHNVPGYMTMRPTDGKHDIIKPKDLVGIPWRVAFALQFDGWWLRSDIIWSKPNPMPESVTDRPTKAHEYLFLLTKNAKYYYDAEAIKEQFADERMGNPNGGGQYAKECPYPNAHAGQQSGLAKGEWNVDGSMSGRNKRSVWSIPTHSYHDAHFATFPEKLVEPCILAGSKVGDIVLDPFAGSGVTIMVAEKFGRRGIGIELNRDYIAMARRRLDGQTLALALPHASKDD